MQETKDLQLILQLNGSLTPQNLTRRIKSYFFVKF